MNTVAQLLREAVQRLEGSSPTARLDAELLLANALQRDRTWLFTWSDSEVEDAPAEVFHALLEGRVAGKPVAWLLGEREFFGHVFRVTPDTLIPRPETEVLVECVLDRLANGEQRVVDAGTGTGAVGISLALARPRWRVMLADIHPPTLAVAADNAQRLGAANIECLLADWLLQVTGPLDAVVSNPPYVPDGDPHLGEGDVRFEPRRALVSGPDGLDAIRLIVTQAAEKLRDGGLLALEHGHDQGGAVRRLLQDAGFAEVTTDRDLAGHDRVTHGRRNAQ